MAMWLAAMDTRVKASVSAGFLTVMDQMERQHCLCWKFDGIRELVDFPPFQRKVRLARLFNNGQMMHRSGHRKPLPSHFSLLAKTG